MLMLLAQAVGGTPDAGGRLPAVTVLPALLLAGQVALCNVVSGRRPDGRSAVIYFWCVGFAVLIAPWAILISSTLEKAGAGVYLTGAVGDGIIIGLPSLLTSILLFAWTRSRFVLFGSIGAGLLACTIGTQDLGLSAMIAWQIIHACVLLSWANKARLHARRAAPGKRCPACGYDLRGLASGSCPECGPKPAAS